MNNDTTRDEPLTGLAEWLRDKAAEHEQSDTGKIFKHPASILRNWAREVDAARRAACSSLPDGPVAERAELLERSLAELVDKIVPGLDSGDLLADAKAASAALSAVSLPDGGAAEREVRSLLWGDHPDCCGSFVGGAEYMGQHERLCCGNPTYHPLSDAQIVSSLRAQFPESAALAAPSAQPPAPEGEVVVTKNDKGEIVAVTRQDEDGRILSVIAEPGIKPEVKAARDALRWDEHIRQNAVIREVTEAASPSAQPSGAPEVQRWIPVTERMPEDGAEVVTLRPREDWMWDDAERYGMDMRDDGVWVAHNNNREHFETVGGAGAAGPGEICIGPAEVAPYTHWMPLLPPPDESEALAASSPSAQPSGAPEVQPPSSHLQRLAQRMVEDWHEGIPVAEYHDWACRAAGLLATVAAPTPSGTPADTTNQGK